MILLVCPSIIRMIFQIIHINRRIGPSQQNLNFVLVKHSQPIRINHIRKTLEKGSRLKSDLSTEPVMRYELDVLQSVFARDRYVAPIRDEFDRFGNAEFLINDGKI